MCSWKSLKKLITLSFTKFQENCQKAREKPSSLVFYPHWIPTRHQKPPPLRRAPPILQLPEPLNSQITTHLKIRKQIPKGSNHSFLNIILLWKLKTINLNFGHMIPPSMGISHLMKETSVSIPLLQSYFPRFLPPQNLF